MENAQYLSEFIMTVKGKTALIKSLQQVEKQTKKLDTAMKINQIAQKRGAQYTSKQMSKDKARLAVLKKKSNALRQEARAQKLVNNRTKQASGMMGQLGKAMKRAMIVAPVWMVLNLLFSGNLKWLKLKWLVVQLRKNLISYLNHY